MKRVLLLSLSLLLGLSSFAQQMRSSNSELKSAKADIRKTISGKKDVASSDAMTFKPSTTLPSTASRWQNFEEFPAMTTTYDLQTNSFLANRLIQWQDGTAAVTANLSLTGNAAAPDRGTGYNYFDGSSFGDEPTSRIEGSLKTGWPSIARYGSNGEIVVSHTGTQLVYFTRENKGEGAWQGPKYIPNPNLGVSAQNLTWPRVVTSGDNNEIIHVLAADQDDSNKDTYLYYARSADGGNSWDVSFAPALGDDITGIYSGDEYAIASNGDVVAGLYVGSVLGNAYIIKSIDNGETWEKVMIWENPYYGLDWETDPNSVYTDTLYAPEHGSLTVGNDGVVHVAFSVREFIHDELGTSYSYFYGLGVDGIMYWNDTEGVIESPDGNPHHACRLWWPTDDSGIAHGDNEDMFAGFIPPDENESYNDWSNDKLYTDYKDYFQGASSHPAIAVDGNGKIAVAYSSPNIMNVNAMGMYYRNVYVSYKDGDDWFRYKDNLMEDFIHTVSEGINVSASPNAVNDNEFLFSYIEDEEPGIAVGNTPSQNSFTNNIVQVVRISTEFYDIDETLNPLTKVSVYPNPAIASDGIRINSSMNTDAKVAFYNISGQIVKNLNVTLNIGDNTIDISDMAGGVYFCTVSAKGFSETTKIVVR